MKTQVNQFTLGLAYIPKGFRYLFQHPHLLIYAAIPALIQVIVLIVLLSVFGSKFGALFDWLSHWVNFWHIDNADNLMLKSANFVLWGITQLLRVAVFMVGLIFVSLFGFLIGMIFSAPFNDILSEKTEATVRTPCSQPLSVRYVWHLVRGEIVKAMMFLSVPLLLLLINVIPVIGSISYIVISGLFGMWAMGATFVDYTVSRQCPGFSGRWHFYRTHMPALAGFGAVFLLPFFSFFFTGPLIVGSTLLVVALQQAEHSTHSL